MTDCKSIRYYLTVWVLILCQCLHYVGAQRARSKTRRGTSRSRRAEREARKQPLRGWRFVTVLFFLALVPPLVVFFRNLYKDPMTPTLWKNALEVFREKMLGFISERAQPRRRVATTNKEE